MKRSLSEPLKAPAPLPCQTSHLTHSTCLCLHCIFMSEMHHLQLIGFDQYRVEVVAPDIYLFTLTPFFVGEKKKSSNWLIKIAGGGWYIEGRRWRVNPHITAPPGDSRSNRMATRSLTQLIINNRAQPLTYAFPLNSHCPSVSPNPQFFPFSPSWFHLFSAFLNFPLPLSLSRTARGAGWGH